jgi:hypothetical protein
LSIGNENLISILEINFYEQAIKRGKIDFDGQRAVVKNSPR